MSSKDLKIQKNPSLTRRSMVAYILGLAGLAVAVGLWLGTNEPKSAPVTIEKTTQAKQPVETANEPSALSARNRRAETALRSNEIARQFRRIVEVDKRIEFLYEKAPLVSATDAADLLSVAGDDPSNKVRLESLLVLENVQHPSFRRDFLAAMAEDPDPAVNDYAFQSISTLDVAERVEILGKSVASKNVATLRRSAETMAMYRTKGAVEKLLSAAENAGANSESAQILIKALNRSIAQSFTNVSQARDWWRNNQALYADDLGLISPP